MYSPLQEIKHPAATAAGIRWYVKRDDLYAPRPEDPYQGNKVRKLKGLIPQLTTTSKLITFGGAYSNHLAATAAFGLRNGLATVGIVRGEPVENPVLNYCRSQGMTLHFITRSSYRLKNEETERARYQQLLGPGLIINEGGSGLHAFVGTGEIMPEVIKQLGEIPDYFQLAAGTAGTAAGVIHSMQHIERAVTEVFSVLKGNWMQAEVNNQLNVISSRAGGLTNWRVISDYHFGGYAKQLPELQKFITEFTTITGIPIEPIYTGKLFYGVVDRIERGEYPSGSILVTYHSGGMIGWPT